jgi:hypothetical protein
LIWKKLIFENFNIFENNIISVKLAKVLLLRYQPLLPLYLFSFKYILQAKFTCFGCISSQVSHPFFQSKKIGQVTEEDKDECPKFEKFRQQKGLRSLAYFRLRGKR